ncbi:MAG TPA: hypothetical protein PLJ65_05605 [Casimicrobium sp.]|nr:hypothetical protein [Casimicrobium sp.]
MTSQYPKAADAWYPRWLQFGRRKAASASFEAAPKLTAIETVVAQTGRDSAKK